MHNGEKFNIIPKAAVGHVGIAYVVPRQADLTCVDGYCNNFSCNFDVKISLPKPNGYFDGKLRFQSENNPSCIT